MLRLLTAGESHGKALVATLEGLPAGIPVSDKALADELARRRHGHGRSGRQKLEQDAFEASLGKMADDALASGSPGRNPVVPAADEIVDLYRRAW